MLVEKSHGYRTTESLPLGAEPGSEFRIYGSVHPMIGTVLMLFLGLPSITRSLYAT
jgi:hypothetical protein